MKLAKFFKAASAATLIGAAAVAILLVVGAWLAIDTAMLDGYNSFNYPQIFHSVMTNDVAGVRYLTTQNANEVSRRNDLGETPLHLAVAYSGKELLDQLHDFGAELNAQDKTGMTPLHVAAMYGRAGAAKWLIDNGAKIELRDRFGDTPLATAAIFGKPELYRLLVQRGADESTKNNDGRTPRQLAEHYGQTEMLAFLNGYSAAVTSQ